MSCVRFLSIVCRFHVFDSCPCMPIRRIFVRAARARNCLVRAARARNCLVRATRARNCLLGKDVVGV
jgi:hypothetical protein